MSVEQINSRRLFGDFGPRAPERVPEGLKFLAKLALIFCFPAIAFSIILNSPLLLCGVIVEQVIGVVCGLILYSHPVGSPLSCVPAHQNPTVPAQKMKKAA
jgi:hypothetical protein